MGIEKQSCKRIPRSIDAIAVGAAAGEARDGEMQGVAVSLCQRDPQGFLRGASRIEEKAELHRSRLGGIDREIDRAIGQRRRSEGIRATGGEVERGMGRVSVNRHESRRGRIFGGGQDSRLGRICQPSLCLFWSPGSAGFLPEGAEDRSKRAIWPGFWAGFGVKSACHTGRSLRQLP